MSTPISTSKPTTSSSATVPPGGPPPAVVAENAPRSSGMWVRYLGAAVAMIWALFPLVFIVSAAVNPSGTLSTTSLWPTNAGLSNFTELFNLRQYGAWYKNTMIICTVGASFQVFIGACAAYAFSRMRFAGRRPGLMALLLAQMFPTLLAFVALYLTFDWIGGVIPAFGLNSLWGLILCYLGGAMGANVWLLKGYFDTVPKELDEAAMVDGATHARIFFTMTLRLVAPILATVGILAFVGLFSEFLLAGIFLKDEGNQTLAVGLFQLLKADKNKYFGPFCAGALLASAPVVLLYLAFQKQLVGGLTAGSVK